MVWLVAIAAAIALLYFWLSGHWFARVLTCLALWPVLIVCTDPVLYLMELGYNPALAALFIGLNGVVAWLIASVPGYVRKRRNAPLSMSLAIRD